MAIHHKIHIWCFPLSTSVNNGDWLSTFTSCSIPPSQKNLSDPQVIRGNNLEYDSRGSNIPSCELFSPSNKTTLPLHAIYTPYHTRNSISSPLTNRRLRSSILGQHISSPKHSITPLQKSLRHSKAELSPFCCTYRCIRQCYCTQAYIG
jgi:hypothetical protein